MIGCTVCASRGDLERVVMLGGSWPPAPAHEALGSRYDHAPAPYVLTPPWTPDGPRPRRPLPAILALIARVMKGGTR